METPVVITSRSVLQPLNLAEFADHINRLRERLGPDAVLVRTEVMEAKLSHSSHGEAPELQLSLRV